MIDNIISIELQSYLNELKQEYKVFKESAPKDNDGFIDLVGLGVNANQLFIGSLLGCVDKKIEEIKRDLKNIEEYKKEIIKECKNKKF